MNCLEEGECLDDTNPEVIQLDTTQESLADHPEIIDGVREIDESFSVDSQHNTGIFEKTLPPGVAPDGFVLLDESVGIINEESKIPVEKEGENIPVFRVTFRDKSIARKYRKRIREFLKSLIEPSSTSEKGYSDSSECILDIWGNESDKLAPSNEQNAANGISDVADHTLFMIDNQPEERNEILNIPTYGKKFERVLQDGMELLEEDKEHLAAPKLNCFNCLGNHNLRDCPEPRNHLEINKNRKDFNARSGPRNVRYHVDDDQRFDHLKPGVLSSELRKALGLSDNQLPRHIYRMRTLGYPPGWLEEARLQHSGLILYNNEGKEENDATEEIGEIVTPESKDKFDMKKVHDFPGFNVPPPSGVRDAFWHPDQQIVHSKEAMLSMMSGRKIDEGYKRKKLKVTCSTEENSASPIVEPVEMEIEEDQHDEVHLPPGVDELSANEDTSSTILNIPETMENPQNPVSEKKDSEIERSDMISSTPKTNLMSTLDISGLDSPSLNELEMKKKLLLEELDDASSQSDPSTPSRTTAIIENVTPTSSKFGSVTSIELGTQLIQSTSPYTRLPSSEKFSKDICDVINFENLPDATGKYEKMAGLIQKVRVTLAANENQE